MINASIVGFYDMKKDTWQTVEKLSGYGYRAIENGEFLLDGDADANLQKLSGYGMKVLSVSADMSGLVDNLPAIIQKAKAIGVNLVCCYWSDPQTYDEALTCAKTLDAAGATLRAEGITLAYHNHDHEFCRSFNGVRYFDILLERTSPDNVGIVLDVGWASVARENVPELMRRLGKRIKLLHFKDFFDLDNRGSFTSLGTGKVDIQTLIAEADALGFEYVSVEQDFVRNLDVDRTVLSSYLTLKESGFVY